PEPTTFFLNFGFLWGFGIWKRTWDLYEFNPSGFEEFLTNQENRYRFNFDNNYSYSNMLQKVKTVGEETNWDIRKSFTWDIQLSYQVFKHRGLFLHPCQSLVRNVGVGVGANYQQPVSSPFSGHDPLIHGNETMDDYLYPRLNTFSLPSKLTPNEKAYQCLCQMFSRFRLKSRQRKTLLQKIRNLPKKVGKFLLSTLKGAPTA
ncbi:MAG: hypothetical protein KDK40_05705, partial [Chlamydiia bacterium]|nr:hypothetical protein [Chlamydiia bacterium]